MMEVNKDAIEDLEAKQKTKRGLNKKETNLLSKFYKQKTQLNKQFKEEQNNINVKHLEEQNKIREKINKFLTTDDETNNEKEITALKAKYEKFIELAKKYGTDYKKIEKKLEEEITKLQQEQRDRVKKEIKDFLSTEKEKEINSVKEKYQKLLILAEENITDTIELKRRLKVELDAIDEKYKDKNIFFNLSDKEVAEIKKKIDKVIRIAQELSNITTAYNNLKKAEENKAMDEYEENINRKKELLDRQLKNGLISEKSHNEQIAGLDKNLDKKRRKIAHEQAKRDRNARLFETVINTAANIVQVFPNPYLMAAAGIIGALNLATIASEPIPKYGDGGRINHPHTAIVGEKGKEIILSNKIVEDKELGPIADDLARIQEGKKPNFLRQPAQANFSGMKKTITNKADNNINNNTVVNQVDTKGMIKLTNEVVKMQKCMITMVDTIDKLKYMKAVISQREIDERNTDEELLLRYSNF